MKISHFLPKICHFGGHFEFLNLSGIKRYRMSNILIDSCTTPNLAMETTCFIPDFQKKKKSYMVYLTVLASRFTFYC